MRAPRRIKLSIGDDFDVVLEAARSGAPWAFERLYHDLAPAVYGYIRLQGSAEPEDLCSEVFMGVFAGLSSFDGSEQQFRSWVFTIAHRRLTDERRRFSRRPTVPTSDADVLDRLGGDAEKEALDALGSRHVHELCSELTAEQRDVLFLRVVADLSVEQVAGVVGRSNGAVKALQRRALTALREKIAREGVTL
ncbi:RNA polymerase sigma factor [Phytoactinopolyspora halophila]|uniref:RNA polymerase sigma factor n=1 Tax=Phytoactinopolyspora halophila TaxID=1981511 RepID=UPI001314915C|nr:sigma-70 family RNA polymerase sigma factor [Phytoactinopolyspora halophila]